MRRSLLALSAVLLVTACQDRQSPLEPASLTLQSVTPLEGYEVLWGAMEFVRTDGEPNVYTVSITNSELEHFQAPFVLYVQNGTGDAASRVEGVGDLDRSSSASVVFDGIEIFGPSDFSQQVSMLSAEVDVVAGSQLVVTLASKPGSGLTVWIEGTPKPWSDVMHFDGYCVSRPADSNYDYQMVFGWDAGPIQACASADVVTTPLADGGTRLTVAVRNLQGHHPFDTRPASLIASVEVGQLRPGCPHTSFAPLFSAFYGVPVPQWAVTSDGPVNLVGDPPDQVGMTGMGWALGSCAVWDVVATWLTYYPQLGGIAGCSADFPGAEHVTVNWYYQTCTPNQLEGAVVFETTGTERFHASDLAIAMNWFLGANEYGNLAFTGCTIDPGSGDVPEAYRCIHPE